jgi:hypothetical protein
MNNYKISNVGFICGLIVWFGIIFYFAAQTMYTCPSVILTSIIAVGMLAPAWVVAILVSNTFNKK